MTVREGIFSRSSLCVLAAAAAVSFLFLEGAPARPDSVLVSAGNLQDWTPWRGGSDATAPRNTVLTDQDLAFVPLHRAFRDAEETFPEWSTAQGMGMPLAANPQYAIHSPYRILHRLLPEWASWAWSGWLKLTLSAWGAWLLARACKIKAGHAALAGLAYGYGGWTVGWLGYPLVDVSCLLPWMLLGIEDACWARHEDRSLLRGTAGAAGAFGVMCLAGHPEVAFYAAVLGLARGLYAGRRVALHTVVALAIGAAIGAASWAPFLAILPDTDAAASPGRLTGIGAQAPAPAMRLVDPHSGGHPLDGPLPVDPDTGLSDWHGGASGYVGLLVALFALEGVLRFRRGSRLLAVVVLLGWGAVYGLPVVGDLVRSVVRWGVVGLGLPFPALTRLGPELTLCAAILAARTCGQRSSGAPVWRRLAALALMGGWTMTSGEPGPEGASLALALAAVAVFLAVPATSNRVRWPWGAAVLAVTGLELAVAGVGFNPLTPRAAVYPDTPALSWLRERHVDAAPQQTFRVIGLDSALPPSTPMGAGLEGVDLYDALGYRPFRHFLQNQVRGWASDPDKADAEALDLVRWTWRSEGTAIRSNTFPLLGVRFLLGDADTPDLGAGFRRVFPPEGMPGARIWEADAWRGRAVLSTETVTVLHPRDLPVLDIPRQAVLAEALELPWPATIGSVEVTSIAPTEVRMTTTTDGDAIATLLDVWRPGWTVEIDGRAAEPLRTWMCLRGVQVKSGVHEIVWRYRTPGLDAGLAASIAGLIAVLALLVAGARGRVPGAPGS